MRVRHVASLGLAGVLLLAACGSDEESSSDTEAAASTEAAGGTTAAGGGDCVVGVSWNNYQEERWAKWDEPALKAAIEAGGGTYTGWTAEYYNGITPAPVNLCEAGLFGNQ